MIVNLARTKLQREPRKNSEGYSVISLYAKQPIEFAYLTFSTVAAAGNIAMQTSLGT